MVELESLEQFADILRQLGPGEAAEMTDDVFALFFPPGIKDDAARGRALAFAWENGASSIARPRSGCLFMGPTGGLAIKVG
jgi:hypothetical protein